MSRTPDAPFLSLDIPAGSNLYHFSRSPDELIADGAFDPDKASLWSMGGTWLTTEPTTVTNCAVTVNEDLSFYDITEVDTATHGLHIASGKVRKPEYLQRIFGIAPPVFDGYCRPNNHDIYTRLPNGEHAAEFLIFERHLGKLTDIASCLNAYNEVTTQQQVGPLLAGQ